MRKVEAKVAGSRTGGAEARHGADPLDSANPGIDEALGDQQVGERANRVDEQARDCLGADREATENDVLGFLEAVADPVVDREQVGRNRDLNRSVGRGRHRGEHRHRKPQRNGKPRQPANGLHWRGDHEAAHEGRSAGKRRARRRSPARG